MTLRRRVLAFLALASICSCALTVGVAAVLIRSRIADQRLSSLERQATVLTVFGGARGARHTGDHVYRLENGRARRVRPELARALLAAIPSDAGAEGTADTDGTHYFYAARPTSRGRVVLVRRASLRFADWRPFLAALLIAGLGGALLAAILALILARRLVRPIGELANATVRLADGERDVTVPVRGHDELGELAWSFNRMSGELAAVRLAQRAFLESVSHELKTPLTVIRGYTEAVSEGVVDQCDGVRVIDSEARQLQRLVDDLLDLARLERDAFSVQRTATDLGMAVSQTLTRHRTRAAELGVTLAADLGRTSRVIADPDRLLQAISNLVENALRLTPAGGTVTLTVAGDTVAIVDTGPGLAAEDLPRAFDRFYLHERYRPDAEHEVGTGLGLAIVAELVTAMGGRVTASNDPAGGARFVISLPPAPAGDEPDPPAEPTR